MFGWVCRRKVCSPAITVCCFFYDSSSMWLRKREHQNPYRALIYFDHIWLGMSGFCSLSLVGRVDLNHTASTSLCDPQIELSHKSVILWNIQNLVRHHSSRTFKQSSLFLLCFSFYLIFLSCFSRTNFVLKLGIALNIFFHAVTDFLFVLFYNQMTCWSHVIRVGLFVKKKCP